MELELDVVWHSDETEVQQKLGIVFHYRDCEIRRLTFYNAELISPVQDEDEEAGSIYSKIHVNGDIFIIKMPYRELKQLIRKERNSDKVNNPSL